ncbi:MAG TPA: hypothetical protein VFE65_36190 [Pseudonocardia sp.]|nr:hypothetical protein [Pseudonocardia sp.]
MTRPKGDPERKHLRRETNVSRDWGVCNRCRAELRPMWMDVTLFGDAQRSWIVNEYRCDCPAPLAPLL